MHFHAAAENGVAHSADFPAPPALLARDRRRAWRTARTVTGFTALRERDGDLPRCAEGRLFQGDIETQLAQPRYQADVAVAASGL